MTRPTAVLAVLAFASCVPHAATSNLPPLQPQCDFVNYHHDESVNVQGPGHCTTDCDCDGLRSCTDGVCQGEARPTGPDACHKPSYLWNEAWNGGGPGLCGSDCECNGTRTCVSGHCQESTNHPGDSAFTK